MNTGDARCAFIYDGLRTPFGRYTGALARALLLKLNE